MKSTPYKFVCNEDGRISEAVSREEWPDKFTAWREAMALCNRDELLCPVPVPMPKGHIIFLRSPKRRPTSYKPVDSEPRLVAWTMLDGNTMAGLVTGADNGALLVKRVDCSTVCIAEAETRPATALDVISACRFFSALQPSR